MPLFIPSEGPCQNHACDGCRTCLRGRCCRKDNPHYELPRVGTWPGTTYGELGVLSTDGTRDKVQCHACGEYFVALGIHAWLCHDLTAQEYRAVFGLRQSTGLAAPSYKQEIRVRNTERLQRVRPVHNAIAAMTAEQHSAMKKGTGLPLETLRDPKYKEAMKRVGTLTTARARRYFCKCGCGTLMPPGHGAHRGQRYIRGHVPPSLADRVATTLTGAGTPLDVQTILAAHPEEDSQVRRALVKLVRAGQAERTERGTYRAVPCEKQQQEKEGEHRPCRTMPPTAPLP